MTALGRIQPLAGAYADSEAAPKGNKRCWFNQSRLGRCDRDNDGRGWRSPLGGLPRGDLRVPGAGEQAAPNHVGGENPLMPRPLAARQLVIHLDAVAIGVAEVDPERDPVIDDACDL